MNHDLIQNQAGVVASWQLTRQEQHEALRLARSGTWRRLSSKVLLASPAQPTEQQRAWAAVLHCGEGSRLGGRNALVLNGWRGELSKPFDVVHGSSLRKVPAWINVRRVEIEEVQAPGLPRVSPHDSVLQAGAWAASDRQAMYFVISALQQRITAPQRLTALLEKRPRLNRRLLMSQLVDEYTGGSQSLNELDLGEVCRRNNLPLPIRQVKRIDAKGQTRSIDAEFESPLGIIRVEVEGMQHMNPDFWLADMRRANRLALRADATSLRYSSWTIRHEPKEFVSDMLYALGSESSPFGRLA